MDWNSDVSLMILQWCIYRVSIYFVHTMYISYNRNLWNIEMWFVSEELYYALIYDALKINLIMRFI